MKSRKILFIIPSLGYAGTNSALSSIYNAIKNKYDIKVLPINVSGQGIYAFREAVVTSDLLTAWDADFRTLNAKQKCLALMLKPFKHLKTSITQVFEKALFRQVGKHFCHKYSSDVVIGFQEGLATKVAAGFPCNRKVTWLHCDYDRVYPEPNNDIKLYEQFDTIVPVSDFTRSTFVKRYPGLQDKTIAIHNLLDIERITTLSLLPINDYTFVKRGRTIISVGRIDPVKRFDIIPQIASELVKNNLSFKWFIIGDGDKVTKKIITDKIREFKVENSVIMLGLKPNPYPYFKEADLLVSTSLSEACPMIFKEAQILGLPIVSADFGSAKEFVFDGINGYVSPIDRLSICIFEFLTNEKLIETIKMNISSCRFENEQIISQLEGIL